MSRTAVIIRTSFEFESASSQELIYASSWYDRVRSSRPFRSCFWSTRPIPPKENHDPGTTAVSAADARGGRTAPKPPCPGKASLRCGDGTGEIRRLPQRHEHLRIQHLLRQSRHRYRPKSDDL